MGEWFRDFIKEAGGVAVIDGGLATKLERHDVNLNDPLWSAKCLLSSPHLIPRGASLVFNVAWRRPAMCEEWFGATGYQGPIDEWHG